MCLSQLGVFGRTVQKGCKSIPAIQICLDIKENKLKNTKNVSHILVKSMKHFLIFLLKGIKGGFLIVCLKKEEKLPNLSFFCPIQHMKIKL